MWARVKGTTENDLLRLPFRAAYMFRPALIMPLHGVKSRTRIVRVTYALIGPLLPLLRAWMPKHVTTTEQVGRAMIAVAQKGWAKAVLENWEIDSI
jgi:hypothetical protein